MDIGQIFLIFGVTGTILMGAVAYLIKTLTSHLLNKEVERFKLELKKESERDKIQYSLLQTKRADVIAEFYSRLDKAHNTLGSHVDFFQPADENLLKNKRELAGSSIKEFVDYYYSHKIYFNKETCDIIESVISKMKQAWIDFDFKDKIKTKTATDDLWSKAWKSVNEDIPVIREKLEISFRKILGMEV